MIATTTRVEDNSSETINRQIAERTNANIERYRNADRVAIEQRLKALDREWNIERAIELEAPLMIATGALLARYRDKRWAGLSAFAASMLLFHSFQGWYPLIPIFRRMGIRTANEIANEREALKAIRGDHQSIIKH